MVRAIILIYNGSEPTRDQLAKIVATAAYAIPMSSDVKTLVLDEKEIASGILFTKEKNADIDVIVERESKKDKVTKAVIAVGERFGELLKKHYTYEFNTALMYAYVIAAAKGCDNELIDAIEILANEDSMDNIDINVIKKYNFNPHHLNIIKEIYHTTCAGRIVL